MRELHEECGVVGLYGVPDAARAAGIALQYLQHRGQQGCGIAAAGPDGQIRLCKRPGLVKDVFREEDLTSLPGSSCIGHVRYPTSDIGGVENLQPFAMTGQAGSFAVAHNGNIVNAEIVRSWLEKRGSLFHSTSDSELFAQLIGMNGLGWESGIRSAANQLDGAYSTVVLTADTLFAFRDRYGFRPLSLGRLGDGWIVASETCALDAAGADFIRDIEPGEVVAIGASGLRSFRYAQPAGHFMCAMEYIYFARPDSDIEGCNVHAFRKRAGALLYREHPVEADIVICVPDSGMSAAIGYSEAGKIPLEMGLLKNAYVARTFIQPAQELRDIGVRMKLSPIRSIVGGKRVAVIDDSIVRGTTSRRIVRMLREAGATQVHMLISSPKYAWPCFYGIDTGTREQLIGAANDVERICAYIGADSLHYLSEEALLEASGRSGLCTACFSGRYPTDLYGREDD
jgi:amidophosphoribosyltransferase